MGFTQAQRAKFDALYKTATMAVEEKDVAQARMRQLLDQMMAILEEAGVSQLRYMHPKSIVPHIGNRGGSKMQWQKIYEKMAKIISVGVSLKECGPNKAIAFAEDPYNKHSGKAHIELCRTSPHYALYTDIDMVEGGSVGCGHWNQSLACIQDSRPVPEKWLKKLCEEGNPCLDAARLGRDQPDLRKLLQDGLRFTMIPNWVEKQYPLLPHVFQKALNIEHNIGEGLIALILCAPLLIL